MAPVLESTDARNKYEDLSGVDIQPGDNPYTALITASDDDSVRLPAGRITLFLSTSLTISL